MRKYQLTIKLDCFEDSGRNTFSVYADANNVWEVVCAGFRRLIDQLNYDYQLPSFGVVSSSVNKCDM